MRSAGLAAVVASLALTGCFGVSEKHSVLVKPVPVKLLFQSTPTPSASPSAAVPVPVPTPAATASTPNIPSTRSPATPARLR